MGYWLRKKLHTESAVDAGQTYRYKLPTTGFFSAFSVHIAATRYADRASTTTNQLLIDAITKVELISEATKVIKSMRGRELLALNLYDFGRVGEWQHGETDGDSNDVVIYFLAGRHLQDKEYMFDMSRFIDPELAITNDLTEDTAEYWDADSLEYDIYGWRWVGDPVPSPKGYMRADERVYYDTSADGAEKVIRITRGKRIRRLLVMGHEVGDTIGDHIDEMELQVNEGEYSPVTITRFSDWAWQNTLDYGLSIEVAKTVYVKSADEMEYVDTLMDFPYFMAVTPHIYGAKYYANVCDFGNGLARIIGSGAGDHDVLTKGAGYLGAILIGFDKEPDLSDMLNTADMSELKLIITEDAADKTVSLVVEEEVLY